ncbi:MAG: choice-of-anchor D domain-containing protein, partial [Catenulispora sp.]|nr:choice-of-anchor D domain-containing protein [Catenulispora sp.]
MTSKRHIRLSALGTAATVISALAQPVTAHADVTTISVDNLRSGWDSSEPALGPAAITSSSFGQIFSTPVNGQVYAQPLVAGHTLVVATEENEVYGLDPVTGAVAWHRNDLGPAFQSSTVSCPDLQPSIGVTSTPVYDASTGTIYLTSKTYSGGVQTAAHWYMHALDAATGVERPNWPVEIKGSPDNDPTTQFDAFHQMQRPGLLLLNGVVYAAFGGHCDFLPYRGFVVGVDTAKAAQTAMWTDEADGVSSGAGIWQSGSGLMSDGDGRIFFASGNGMSPHSNPDGGAGVAPPQNLGESVVRLQVGTDGKLSAADYFSPTNNADLDINDRDLGSGGPMGLPEQYFANPADQKLLVEQGKDGRVFVLDRDHLGGFAQGDGGTDDAVGVVGPFAGQWGHPAVWGGDGGYVYIVGAEAQMRAFHYGLSATGTPTLTPVGHTTDNLGYTSGSPIVTSDGTTSGSAVVWVVATHSPAGAAGTNADLRAYNAIPNPDGSMQLLFSAPIGTAAKFSVPATDNGRVYVGTRDGHVIGFGSPTTAPLTAPQTTFPKQAVGTQGTATVTLTATTHVQVTGASTSSAVFGVNTSVLANPVVLEAGDTLQLPVTFNPTAPGTASGILRVQTADGTIGVSLTGTGTQDGLGSNPATLAFNTDQPTGIAATLPVRIVNTGTTDEKVVSAAGPAASGPYSVTGLPAADTVLAPGDGLDATVTYYPTTAGASQDSIVITSSDGSGTHILRIPLSGTAVTGQGVLSLTPSTLDFGDVPLGTTKKLSFTVANTGNVPLTITKAKAPDGEFQAVVPIDEGRVLGPEQSVKISVTFTPTALGPAAGDQPPAYEVTPDTGVGAMYVTLLGNGVPAPVTPPPTTPPPTTAPPTTDPTPVDVPTPPPAPTTEPAPPTPQAPAPAGGNPTVTRLSGNTRYETGVAVSRAQWANAGGDPTGRLKTAHGVVLARGDKFPDALAGVPLAAKVQGPLLLTDPTSLTGVTETEIRRVLGTSGTVDILGGTAAVSADVENRLRALGYTVNRYSGPDRDATALDIARRGLGDPAHVVLATGQDYADALSAGPF